MAERKFEEHSFDTLSLKKSSKKRRARHFYKVENHQELFKIGASFLSDYQSGIKSFAISSTGYHTSQQKTIMGLASFFDHQQDLKIAIVTEGLENGYFSDVINFDYAHEVDIGNEMTFNVLTFHDHFDFLSLEELLLNEKTAEEDEDLIENIDIFLDSYDLIFWDVPEIHRIQTSLTIYFPMLERFECLSLIVAQSRTKKEEIDHIVNFFRDYGVTLKGFLFDGAPVEDNVEDKKPKGFFRRFFK